MPKQADESNNSPQPEAPTFSGPSLPLSEEQLPGDFTLLSSDMFEWALSDRDQAEATLARSNELLWYGITASLLSMMAVPVVVKVMYRAFIYFLRESQDEEAKELGEKLLNLVNHWHRDSDMDDLQFCHDFIELIIEHFPREDRLHQLWNQLKQVPLDDIVYRISFAQGFNTLSIYPEDKRE